MAAFLASSNNISVLSAAKRGFAIFANPGLKLLFITIIVFLTQMIHIPREDPIPILHDNKESPKASDSQLKKERERERERDAGMLPLHHRDDL